MARVQGLALVGSQARPYVITGVKGEQGTSANPRSCGQERGFVASSATNQPTSSVPLKKKAISMAAFSSLSEPWTALRPLDSA